MDDFLTLVAKDGTLAVMFGLLLWWMTNRQEKWLGAIAKNQQIMNLLLVGLQKELLVHDLTVNGINPSAGGDQAERESKAYAKYLEVERIMDAIRTQIESMDTSSK